MYYDELIGVAVHRFSEALDEFFAWEGEQLDADLGYEPHPCGTVLGKVLWTLGTDKFDAREQLTAWLYNYHAAGTPDLPEGYSGDLESAIYELDAALHWLD